MLKKYLKTKHQSFGIVIVSLQERRTGNEDYRTIYDKTIRDDKSPLSEHTVYIRLY